MVVSTEAESGAWASVRRVSYTLPALISYEDDPKRRYLPDSSGTQCIALPLLDLPQQRMKREPLDRTSSPWVIAQPGILPRRARLPQELRPKHLRSVSALALTHDTQPTLYSAGRDGLVCAWDLAETIPQCKNSMRPHRSWIWDMQLCNNDETVLTASSDGTVKAWTPENGDAPYEVGTHSDYVTSIASAMGVGWVASGSLDKTVSLWDLRENRRTSMWHACDEASIYTMDINHTGSLIMTGGTTHTPRGWDPRMRDPAFDLLGHTETIRALHLSSDGRYLLSGSSDATVRLWSIGEQRCLHTFTHHNSSVWSLYSDKPDFSAFYSGDRQGLLCRVEWDQDSPLSNSECVVLAREPGPKAGITSIAARPGHDVWTSNSVSPSIRRWSDIPPHALRRLQSSTGKRDGIPVKSLVDVTVCNVWNTLVDARHVRGSAGSTMAQDAQPLFPQPLAKLRGVHGLVHVVVLNDRVHALCIDTTGIITLWHLVRAECLGTFDPASVMEAARAAHFDSSWQPRDTPLRALELVQSLIEGKGATTPWCSVDTSSGVLRITLDKERLCAGEMYANDLLRTPHDPLSTSSEERVFIGLCVLRNLFRGLTEVEARRDLSSSQPLLLYWQNTFNLSMEQLLDTPLSQLPGALPSAVTFRSILANMASVSAEASAVTPETLRSGSVGETRLADLFTRLAAEAGAETTRSPPNTSEGGVKNTIRRTFSRRSERPTDESVPSARPSVLTEAQHMVALGKLLGAPKRRAPPNENTPVLNYAPNITLELLREEPLSGTHQLVYGGTIGSTERDAPLLEMLAPIWLLQALLSPEPEIHESQRMRVFIERHESNASLISELPGESRTVTTGRMLKLTQVAGYIQDALADSGKPVGGDIEFVCNNQSVPLHFTLAQCHQHCWRQPGDVRLEYRLSRPLVEPPIQVS